MIRTLAKATLLASLLCGGDAFAQVVVSGGVSAEVSIPAPTISFEVQPPLVVVSPGVYVVEDYDQEVFFVSGWYWCRSGNVWYRTRDYHGGWATAPGRYVPRRLAHMPPGHYKNFRAGPGHPVWHRGGGPTRVHHVGTPFRAQRRSHVQRGGGGGRVVRVHGGRGGFGGGGGGGGGHRGRR
jgi:hypothetical protein